MNNELISIDNTPISKLPIQKNIELLNKLSVDGKQIESIKEDDIIELERFHYYLIKTLSGNDDIYSTHVNTWRQEYPILFQSLDASVKEITPDTYIDILDQIVKEEKSLVNIYRNYVVGIGRFQDKLFNNLSGHNNIYQIYIVFWRQKYPYLFQLLDEHVTQKDKNEMSSE